MTDRILSALKATIAAAKKSAYDYSDDENRLKVSGLYSEWQPGQHNMGDIYNAEGQTWECFQAYDNAVYPDIVPGSAAWRTFNRPLHGKSVSTAQPYIAPTGAHDMYKAGEYMIFRGIVYKCLFDTAYSPEEYKQAWEAVK